MTTKQTFKLTDHPFPALEGVRQVRGEGDPSRLRFGLVVSRFNGHWTGALAEEAVQALEAAGVPRASMDIAWVPGAYEIPTVVRAHLDANRFDALLALGVVVQGETPHADLITQSVARTLNRLAADYAAPVIDGVVAARSPDQAEARCSPGPRNRGRYAAEAALEMALLMHALRTPAP